MEMSASTLPTEEGNASSDPSALSQGYVEHQRERIKLSFKQESTARAPVCESEKEGHMEVEKGSLDQLRMLSQQRRSVDALIPSAERSTGAECNAAASKEPKTGGMVVERENELEKFLSFGSPKRRELTNHKEDFSFVHPSSAPPTGSPSFAQKGDRVSSQKSNLTIPPETPQVSSLLKGGTDPPETSQVFRQTKLAEEKQSVGSAENLEMLKRDLGFDDSQDKSRAGEPEFALPSAARVTNREDIPAQEVVTETMVEIADVRVEKHAAADVTQRQQAKPETLHRSILARVCAWSAWSACCGRVQPAGAVPPAVRALFDDVTGGEAYATVEDLQVFVTTTQMGPLGKKNGGSHVHQVRKERVHLRKILTMRPERRDESIDLDAFYARLLDPDLNAAHAAARAPTQDMTRPLSHYFISSSHNTYLPGAQVGSRSTPRAVARALLAGCRVIELDLWPEFGRIVIQHTTRAFAGAASFTGCLRAVRDNAFRASDYPVILTLENHLSPHLQKKAAQTIRAVFGDLLFVPPPGADNVREFLSPEDLKRKIIISDAPGETAGARNVGQLAKLLMAIHVKSRKPPDDDSSGKGDVTMTSGGVLRPESEELYGSKGEREDSPGGASTGEGKHGSKESGRVAGKDASTGEFERLTPEEEFRRLSPGNVPLEEIPLGVDPRERLAAYHAAYGGRGAADEESLRKIRKELEKERARLMQEWKRRERLARKPAAKPVVPPVRKLLTSASSIGRRREARDSGGRNDSSGGEAELVEKGKGKEAEERKEGTTEGGKLYSKTWPQEQRVKGGSAFAFVATETETQEGRKPANAGGNISTVEAAGTSHQAPAGEGSVLAPEPEPLAPERRKTETVSEIEAAPCTTSSHGARARDVAVPRAGAPPPDVEETAGRQLLEDVEEDEAEQDSAAERERERNPLAIPIPHADERARPIEEDDLARLVYIPSLQKGFRQWKGLAMVNASEAAFMRAIAERPRFVIWYTRRNLGRVYPSGRRLDSSNFNPMLAWIHGVQMPAMNIQTPGRPLWLHFGMFTANGGTGYVLKPDVMLPPEGTPLEAVFDPLDVPPPSKVLTVQVVGVPGDTRKFWTGKTPASHGPSWEDARFRFPLSMPEIALLCFEAHEEYKTGLEEYFVGQAVIPVWELMLGYRVVQLKTKKGEVKRHGPRLLCKFEMTDAGDKLSA